MNQSEEKNPVQVADRLFGMVELLASEGTLGLTAISNRLKLNKSTVHRLLNSLIFMGYVKQNEENGRYELTMKLVDLANRLMDTKDVVQIVRPHLRRLMELSGETVHFVERDGADAVYIDKVESFSNKVQMVSHIGSRLPMYCSGVGKAIAAELDARETEEIWRSSVIVRRTPYTITDYQEFRRNLEEVRERGYALDNEENETGVRCVAASLRDYNGRARYAFSISAPVHRMYNDRIAELARYILEAKKEIQKELLY